MKNRWKDQDARRFLARYKAFGPELALRTYTARLVGQDPNLVLHGGGNTSVKTVQRTVSGDLVPVLCIKGSGWDLDTIEPQGHPAVKMEALESLRALLRLSDEAMVNVLRTNMLDASGPTPSVETLLHAFLPHAFIDHSHADAVLSLTNQPDGERRVRAWARGRMGIVPYIMPGLALAKLAAEVYEKKPDVEGLILLKHGIFTFGDSARESYDRMIQWVGSAERLLNRSHKRVLHPIRLPEKRAGDAAAPVANILRGACDGMIVRHRSSPAILEFVGSREASRISQQGPATPDHIIRTKAVPLLLGPVSVTNEVAFRRAVKSRVAQYEREYEKYFKRQCRLKKVTRRALDPVPRIILVPGLGLFSAARDARAANVALDIYEHTIGVITRAERIGRYEALSEAHLFDMEYWSLEQAKLGKETRKPFGGKVVWISGAASGIGLATAKRFGQEGAHVFLTDVDSSTLNEAVASLNLGKQVVGMVCDVTKKSQVDAAFERCSLIFGGVDIVISNAGIAPMSDMADCSDEMLRKSFDVNFFAHQYVAQAAIRIFKRQGSGGTLLFNASKSAFNPGPGFGPYSLPKAGVIALMRQYAIELGEIGVRVNAVNADRVRTNLFSGGLLVRRAQARGLSVKEYVSGNLLHEEVYADDVAQAFAALALAQKTTGAVLPVDGGNAAAFPR